MSEVSRDSNTLAVRHFKFAMENFSIKILDLDTL